MYIIYYIIEIHKIVKIYKKTNNPCGRSYFMIRVNVCYVMLPEMSVFGLGVRWILGGVNE
jgi:hypothetical protein